MNKNKSKYLYHKGIDIVTLTRDDLDKFPTFLQKGKGAYVWDYDNNKFIDFTCSKGAIILGYSNDEVDNAVISHIKNNGNIFFTQYSKEKLELAEVLTELIPCAERAMFFKSGSDATSAAIRLARVYTGNSVVLSAGYHGWHDWALKMFPEFELKPINDMVYDFAYNIDLLDELINRHNNNIACLIITPEPNFFEPDFLLKIKSICLKNNIILIFDEVKTGFRFTLGGYQKFSGVTPDIATFSKGMSNGYGLSVVVGNREIMNAYSKTHLWGTYMGEMIPFVAALKTIEIINRDNVIDHIWRLGSLFINELSKLFIKYNVCAEICKYPSIFHIIFDDTNLANSFFTACLENGLLLYANDNQMISYAHNEEIIIQSLGIAEISLAKALNLSPVYNKSSKVSKDSLDSYTLGEFGGLVKY